MLRLILRFDEISSNLMIKSEGVKRFFINFDDFSSGVMIVQDWNTLAKTVLRAEMSRRKVTASELAKLLQDLGLDEDPRALGNKISRGTFSAAFLLQCLSAMKVQNLHLGEG